LIAKEAAVLLFDTSDSSRREVAGAISIPLVWLDWSSLERSLVFSDDLDFE
jgi:hypothetical protein